MNVKVKYFAYFRELFGTKERDISLSPPAPIRDLLDRICDTPARRAELFDGERLKAHIVVMIDGTALPAATGLETTLEDGVVVSVFPLMGGG